MRIASSLSVLSLFALGALCCNFAAAQTLVQLVAVPTSWLLQNYVPNQVTVFFSGSSCLSGQLIFPSTAIQADQDRLWAMILTAKATQQAVVVYYYVSGTSCYISSFGLPD